MNKFRMAGSFLLLSAVVVGVLYIPLPHYVWCSVEVQPRDAATVYVDSSGSLESVHVEPGEWVQANQPLMQLDSPQIKLAIVKLLGEKADCMTQYENLKRQQYSDHQASQEVAEVEKMILAIDEQIAHYQTEYGQLSIRAPIAGQVFASPERKDEEQELGLLPNWTGQPLDPQNVGSLMTDGVAVCRIGDPRQLEAILAIDQSDVEFVASGQQVDIFLVNLPARKLPSQVGRISQVKMQAASSRLSHKTGGTLETKSDKQGYEQPISTTYQADAPLEDSRGEIFIGGTGQARIHVGRRTVGQRLWRYVQQTFSFEM